MCGIVGQFGSSIDEHWLNQELVNLRHRGPDNQSALRVSEKLLMGSTRLAMTDPNPRSHQPMTSEIGKSTITFNGEIYNYKELRKRLENKGIVFTTESDTEVLIKWLDIHGVSGLKDLNGMYSLAYYSKIDKKLVLARDHLGKKPLFTLLIGGNLYWSSSMTSLLVLVKKKKVNLQGLFQYLSLGYTLDPDSILNEIQSVMPGEAISYSENLTFAREKITQIPSVENSLRSTILTAVKNRVAGHSDIALSLSGGLDSTIIAVALAELGVSFKTYSAIWKDSDKLRYNTDAILAASISQKIGVENFQIEMINAKNLPAEIVKFVRIMGEPNNNPSGISMLRLYEEISKRGNRLVITGDGADELFGGYARHMKTAQMRRVVKVPDFLQLQIAKCERNTFSRIIQNLAVSQMRNDDPMGWLHWHWVFRPAEISNLAPGIFDEKRMIENLSDTVNNSSLTAQPGLPVQLLLLRDSNLWLVNESNRKLDRISMEYSIEARSPFQDDSVIAHAKELMSDSKYMLLNKKILKDAFPETKELGVRDDKAGFTSPVGHWLRSNPEFLAHSLRMLNSTQIFSKKYIETLIEAPNTGSYQKIMQSWTMLVFSKWVENLGSEVDF
jgi:asparagine synthase (glutamine-hydrolysing)